MSASILMMDNCAEFLETQARVFENAGYSVIRAGSIGEAERVLATQTVDLAVCDVRMEDEDNEYDVSGLLLAQRPELRDIPKIILSAYPSCESVVQALRSTHGRTAALEYVAKGAGPKLLLERVAFVIQDIEERRHRTQG